MFLRGRHAGAGAPAGDLQRVPQRRARGEGDQARDRRLLEACTSWRRARRCRAIAAADYGDPALWRPIALANEHRRPARARDRRATLARARSCRIAIPRRGEVFGCMAQPPASPRSSRFAIDGQPIPADAARRDHRASRCQTGSRAPTASSSRSRTSACAGSTTRCCGLDDELTAVARLRARPARAGLRRRDRRHARRRSRAAACRRSRSPRRTGCERLQQGTEDALVRDPDPDGRQLPAARPRASPPSSAPRTGCVPMLDPVGAALSVICSAASTLAVAVDRPARSRRSSIRKQDGESDFDFLSRVARENGWEMFIDHSGPLGGRRCASCRRSTT